MSAPEEMYQCQTINCGYIYDPDKGDRKGKIKKGTPFHALPDDWRCPVCGATKKAFRPLAGPGSVHSEMSSKAQEKKSGTGGGMKKYRCNVCGYVYDPEQGDSQAGIPPGTSFDDLPDDWCCPVCAATKEDFTEI